MYINKYAKKFISSVLCAVTVLSVAACSSTDTPSEENSSTEVSVENIAKEEATTESTQAPEEVASDEPYVLPEGMYFSELTGEPISEEIKDQRPIAAMVDNEIKALPHYETTKADVVYEMMNSTANDRITRLMCVVKDWGSIEQFGSIRSTRPTNIILASEWNAILCHDGGPVHNNAYFDMDWAQDHISGLFSRVNNGKDREFTEYIISGDLEREIPKANISLTYNEFANEGSHFNFVDYGTELNLDEKYSRYYTANKVSLPFPHNSSTLTYNPETGLYEYSEYGERHEDADSGEVLAFKNVILQKCSFAQLDDEGYLIYNCIGAGEYAWYLTNGVAKDVTWVKPGYTDVTKFYDENGDELEINTGKTYIALVPDDTWEKIIFE